MTFTSVEIIALILIIVAIIKMLVLVVKPMTWMKFTRWIYKKPSVTKFIGAILAGITLYYLINMGITIVQILAISAFIALLFVIGLAEDVGPFIKKYEAQIRAGKLWKKHWFYTLLWLILLAWGVKELFF
ncbi:MAG: hypothetical protein KKF67_02795 [Nanoarchaeota archaeon]|nr:hypothetical protein [Nanoarchaeota archaeon]MBU3926135.1 hypothetical protein [Patescibacteria group bacterium]